MPQPLRIIIIGASSGIGKALAIKFCHLGCLVGAAARNEEGLNELKTAHPAIITKVLDVSEIETAQIKTKEFIAELGGLDILIIAAGIGFQNPKLELEKEIKTINTNVLGFTAIANLAFHYFVSQKKGHLVGITSIMGLRGEQGAPAYSATKGYQSNYLESLRQRACRWQLPITVTEIQPGFMQSKMGQGDNVFWSASLEKAAKQIMSAIKKKKDHAYVTKRWLIIALLLKIVPRSWYKKIRFSKNN